MKTTKLLVGTFLLAALTVFVGCNDDDKKPSELSIVSIMASGTDVLSGEATEVDLNGASSAEGVPVDVVVKITFDKDLDAETVSETTVSITDVATTVSASGATLTITSTEELARGTIYTLEIGALEASDGGTFTSTSRTFKTGGRAPVVAPNESSQLAFWKFDGDANDETGMYNPDYEANIEYVTDRHGEANSAVLFDGDVSIIEVNNASDLMVERSGWTISFWMKTDTLDNLNASGTGNAGQFVFGLGAFYGFRMEANGTYSNISLSTRWEIDNGVDDPYTRGEGFSFNGDGNYNETGGWRGHSYEADLENQGGLSSVMVNNWKHVVFTYDASSLTASIFIDGELMKEQQYLLYDPHPQTSCVGWKYSGEEPNVFPDLAFGFVQSRRGELWDTESYGNYDLPTSNHYKGELDDFRIFSSAFTSEDVTDLYNAEKP
ncbi:MAG: Ig-like domain-containing protein [Cyclobacteriaceae bacterium]